jgi:hypothetical protein
MTDSDGRIGPESGGATSEVLPSLRFDSLFRPNNSNNYHLSNDSSLLLPPSTSTRLRKTNKSSGNGSQPGRRKVSLPRMIDRNLPFHQSRNKMNVRNVRNHHLWKLQLMDWFHTMLRLPACMSVGLLLGMWIGMIFFFATVYWYQDHVRYESQDCGLGIQDGMKISLSGAFAFSLETCTTVGYGLPGTSTSFFEKGCSMVQGTIFVEMVCSMMFNAFLLSFFFSLLSKSEARGSQIIFTDKLLVNVGGGRHGPLQANQTEAYVRLQCYDIDSAHPLIEAHARMYFLDHRLKMHPLRLMDPNDDLGAFLYPSVPADIVHHIDHHSALCPPRIRRHNCPLVQSSHGVVLRSLDSYTGNRDEFVCPVCGESYGTYERWQKHIEYASMCEEGSDYPPEKSHRGFTIPPPPEPITIASTVSEIIVVVEATDPQMSGSFQSLQSYKYEDIVFGEEFEKCMSARQKKDFSKTYLTNSNHTKNGKSGNKPKGVFCVDMNQFHKTSCNSSKLYNNNNNNLHDSRMSDLTEPSTRSAANAGYLSGIRENDDGDDGRDDSSGYTGPQPIPRSEYFARSYNTFDSLRSFRLMWGGTVGTNSSNTDYNADVSEDSDDEEETIVHDRMPPYTLIV